MAIVVREGSHPLSERPFSEHAQPHLRAESLAQVHLGREIERYARRESVGRSALISGHRGAGKTTLVLNAIADAQVRLAGSGYRALAVRIPAPTLLLEDQASAPNDAVTGRDVEQVLRRVTVALAQAVLDEVHAAFLDRAARDDRVQDLVELASRLRIDMERAPSLAGLRDIWRRAGLLERGLFGAGGAEGAGFREILALWNTNEAWQVAGGKVRRTIGAEQKASNNASAKWDMVTNGRELLNPLLGLVSGALVGVSLLDEGGAWAAIGGTLAGLATATGLNFTAERLVQYSQDQGFTFEPDTSVYSLSLLLPRLVSQLREIGLAPVFVVDELDKVRQLRDKMQALVRHLKYLVTEDAFFCFLTDRSYFEYLRIKGRGSAYPEEYTYFTDRLYVVYRPKDLHSYLRVTLRSDAPNGSAEARTDALDAEVVRSVLLFRSRMHLIDLKRHIRALMDERSALSLRPGSVRSGRMFRLETAYQTAVEWCLDQGLLRVRTARDAWFLQLLYDALYYPAERWAEGVHELNVDRGVFEAYLLSRMDTEALTDLSSVRDLVSEGDLELLHEQMLRVVAFLQAPRALALEIAGGGEGRQAQYPPVVLDALDSDEGMLEPLPEREGVYVWRFDPYGRRLRGADAPSSTGQVSARVQALEALLREVGGPVVDPRWMAEQALVLPPAPSWAGFQLALKRLEAMGSASYPERGEHETVVVRYGEMLSRNLSNIGIALVLAALVGRTLEGVSARDCVRPGLEELGELLGRAREPAAPLLARLAAEVPTLVGMPVRFDDITEAPSFELFAGGLRRALELVQNGTVDTRPESALAQAWSERWLERFGAWLEEGRTRFEPGLADLLYGERSGLAPLFHWEDLRNAGIVGWSRGLLDALGGASPAWIAVVALEILGLPRAAALALARPGVPGPLGARWSSLLRQRHGHHPSTRRGVLILGADPAPVESWSCPSHYGALVLDIAGIERLLSLGDARALGIERLAVLPDAEGRQRLIAGQELGLVLPQSAALDALMVALGRPLVLAEPAVARKLHPGLGVVPVGDDADATLERVFNGG